LYFITLGKKSIVTHRFVLHLKSYFSQNDVQLEYIPLLDLRHARVCFLENSVRVEVSWKKQSSQVPCASGH